ncbi:MAG: hypothetical protein J6U21_16350 [Bacteroidales bacterium]|nr:hypothetical protein [Bacteroidales bacterium]
MGFPKVKVSISDGNLLRTINAPDAVPALLTKEYTGGILTVFSPDDAAKKGITSQAFPKTAALVAMFFKELAGNTRLFIAAQTAANLENLTARGVNIAVWHDTSFTYESLLAISNTLKSTCQKMQSSGYPVRVLVGGNIDEETLLELNVKELDNPYIGIVAGEDSATGVSIAAAALARCCKYGAHIKIGSGQNGALVSITDVNIGGKAYTDYNLAQLEVMHDNGYIMPQHRTGTAGYFFGQDNMCSNGDFRILAHGRIIDKAQVIIQQAYAPFIEDTIRVSDDGTLDEGDVSYLENVLECSILANMTSQISGVQVVIDKQQDIINTSTLEVSCRIQPLGYATWINVTLGLATALSNS